MSEWTIEPESGMQIEVDDVNGHAEWLTVPQGHLTVYQTAQLRLLESINNSLADIAWQLRHLSTPVTDRSARDGDETYAIRTFDWGE